MPSPDGTRWRIIEASRPGTHYAVSYSPCGKYTMLRGHEPEGAVQRVLVGGFADGNCVACRCGDDEPWMFRDPEKADELRVSFSDACMNPALAAATVVSRLPQALAELCGVSAVLCDYEMLDEMHTNHRFKALREFDFKFTVPVANPGTGRRAENNVRHQNTNYDEMLKAAGGLLWPEQYERIRAGTDRIVRSLIVEAGQ
jgi:hypothetical protein